MKKLVTVILTLCLAVTALTGCGGPKMEAPESVKAIYDLYILNKTDGVSKLGLSDKEIKEAQDTYDTALTDMLRSNLASAGVEVEESVLTDIGEARKEALSKMTASCELVSDEKNKAVVKLSTTYFDEAELDTNAAVAAAEKVDSAGIEDEDEYLNMLVEEYTKNLIEAYKVVTPSEDKKEITVECSITENVWLPTDMTGFGTDLGLAVSGE